MQTKFISLTIALSFMLCHQPLALAQSQTIDTALAHQYFQEAQAACTQDGRKLWGISLCGPLMFVDPATRAVAANQGDAQGLLTKQGEVFVGRLPDKLPIANFAFTWAGVKWTMVVWPFLPQDSVQRLNLMMHESYHRIQDDLKLPASNPANDHLDSRDGRIWLQLEWRALRQALVSQGRARHRAVADALLFRHYRRRLFALTDASERALEMNEGLAAYTGHKLSAKTDKELIENLVKQIDQANERPTFVRSFAYVSGPAYGVLLDAAGASWRKGLTPHDDLGERLRQALRISLPPDVRAKAEKQAAKYDGAGLMKAESERELARQKRMAQYRTRFVDGPVLLLPLTGKVSVSFNPNNLVSLDGLGTVYPTATISDEWGSLEVSNGALLIREAGKNTKVYVTVPADLNAQPLTGDGWSLQLSSGWAVVAGQRPGDYVLKKLEQ
jgi:phage tail protein X